MVAARAIQTRVRCGAGCVRSPFAAELWLGGELIATNQHYITICGRLQRRLTCTAEGGGLGVLAAATWVAVMSYLPSTSRP